MGFGGTVKAMVDSLKNNASLIKRKRWIDGHRTSELKYVSKEKMGGLDKKASPQLLERIREEQQKNKRRRARKAVFGTFLLSVLVVVSLKFIPSGDAYVFWRVPKERVELPENRIRAESHYAKEGRKYLELGHYQQALKIYQSGKKAYPNEYGILFGEALTWLQIAKRNENYLGIAIERIETLHRNHPDKENAVQLKEDLEVFLSHKNMKE